jgi:carbamoylphosphate synthase large subunit
LPHQFTPRFGREQAISSRVGGEVAPSLDEALAKGWTVVDMKNDWKVLVAKGVSAQDTSCL